jgi:hypothetical protein
MADKKKKTVVGGRLSDKDVAKAKGMKQRSKVVGKAGRIIQKEKERIIREARKTIKAAGRKKKRP